MTAPRFTDHPHGRGTDLPTWFVVVAIATVVAGVVLAALFIWLAK